MIIENEEREWTECGRDDTLMKVVKTTAASTMCNITGRMINQEEKKFQELDNVNEDSSALRLIFLSLE